MKSIFNCLILCGLVVLVGCSGGSPKPPSVNPPTGGGDVYLITSLEASNDNPFINTSVLVTATVTVNGSPAPDGTQVEFTSNGGLFISNGDTVATVLSSGGQATVAFGATDAGGYVVQARVKTVTSQVQIAYRNPDTSGGLQIWSINPAEGSYSGGETVVLTGKGIQSPVEVYFTVQGTRYQAVIDQVVPSVPASAAGTITVRTPEPTAADTNQTSTADISVKVNAGTTDEENQSYPSAFTFISNSVIIGDPVIFGVEPFSGRSAGGESVTILGLNFGVDEAKALVKNFDEVYFLFQGQELLAQVERWSPSQIEVITPRFSLLPLTDNQNAGIKLTRVAANSVIKNDIFIVKSDIAEPEITGVSPTAGPMDGGTLVTINGHGFEIPMQVHFGEYEATDVQVIDDQLLTDNDIITCRTPNLSQQGITPPYAVTIRVTNLQTGNNATSSQTFTFGDILYVSQANPTEGQIGDLLTLYGAGFEDPLTAWFANNIEFDVIAVTGTELTLRSPPSLAPTCGDRTGPFNIVLNETGQQATGGTYTLLGSTPTITSVNPIFVDEIDGGAGVLPGEIDIYGVRFNDEVLVAINGFTVNTLDVTVISPEHIHVAGIPTPNDFGRENFFSENPCVVPVSGLVGIQEAPTPVDVQVQNLPLGCQNTLAQALVYQPETQTCVEVPAQIALVAPADGAIDFGDQAVPVCSTVQIVTVANAGPNPLTITGASFGANVNFQLNNPPGYPFDLPNQNDAFNFEVMFCPTVAGTLSDSLFVNSDGGTIEVRLSGNGI